MRRSDKQYPLAGLDLAGSLQQAWEKGWLDDYSESHFLIKAIEKRLEVYPKFYQMQGYFQYLYPITKENFQDNFCINFSSKIRRMISLFGEDKIKHFFTDQLSAGKENYDENQFFRGLSEVSVLSFFSMNAQTGIYEPKTNGKKNPEARFIMKNNVCVDVEVKTPGFSDFVGIKDIVIPTVLLDDQGRKDFSDFCKSKGLNAAMPRVMKIKQFLNDAAKKFEEVDHVHHMNLLYINWTLSEFEESGFQEAFSLMAHPINGILIHKILGVSLGINEDVYDKITAVIVYTESLNGLMFGDFRFIWMKGQDFQPQFGIIGMHNCDALFDVTAMNPYANQLTPIITGIFSDTHFMPELLSIIGKHMLKPDGEQMSV